jgi:hypothetical protein
MFSNWPQYAMVVVLGEFAFHVWTGFTVPTGKRSEHPRGMPLVTRTIASNEHEWEPMASSSANFCRKRAPCSDLTQDKL